ncbi:MAG: type II secretion system protein [Candidatus Saccharimonadales bacterium]
MTLNHLRPVVVRRYSAVRDRHRQAQAVSRAGGFTLVELLVATTITGILLAVLMSFLGNQLRANATQNARAELLLDTQLSLDVINRDVKHAAKVDASNRWADEHAPDGPSDPYSWTSDNDVLVLASPALNSENEFLYEDPFAYITHKNNLIYFVTDNVLYKRILPADEAGNAAVLTCPAQISECSDDIMLAENVSNFELVYYDAEDMEVDPENARSVAVTLAVTTNIYGRDVTADYTMRSVFRND